MIKMMIVKMVIIMMMRIKMAMIKMMMIKIVMIMMIPSIFPLPSAGSCSPTFQITDKNKNTFTLLTSESCQGLVFALPRWCPWAISCRCPRFTPCSCRCLRFTP